jgi:cysteine desulfurase
VKAKVIEVMDILGNPASVHAAGRAARAVVEKARGEVADLVSVKPASITFTSGGTESNALALQSAVMAGVDRIIIGATEHAAVAENARAGGPPVEVWPVDRRGVADLDWLADALKRPGRALVCLMVANNETGVIQPVAEASALVRDADGWLHVDAVGALGKIAVDFNALGADTMALVSHKLGGPFGAGALAAGPRSKIARIIHGGGQEQGRRGGAENVTGIAGFGVAARAAGAGLSAIAAQAAWRDALQDRVTGVGAIALGAEVPRLPQTLGFALEGFESALQVMSLDLAGVMISAGPACSSGKLKPSATVAAMGLPHLADSAIRVSGGWASTAEDWRRCGDVWLDTCERRMARKRVLA